MITLCVVWIEAHYKLQFLDIYLGTVLLDILGIFATVGIVRHLL
jgi:hypothetical protein